MYIPSNVIQELDYFYPITPHISTCAYIGFGDFPNINEPIEPRSNQIERIEHSKSTLFHSITTSF